MPEPRILTLTLNPAVDVACEADAVVPTIKIRTSSELHDPGGGGVNVARVLGELGADTVAVVLAGGGVGAHLEELINAAGVPCQRLRIAGHTRICTTVYDRSTGQEYRFVPEGPVVSPGEFEAARLLAASMPGDWLVASGSLPRDAPEDSYLPFAADAAAAGRHFVLDSSGPALARALGRGLALIKPSLREFRQLTGRALPDTASQDEAACELVASGAAERIAVSLGDQGALLATREGLWRMAALPVQVRGTVGAGDSFVAAMVLALARGAPPREALAWGMAAGAAAVISIGTAHPKRADVETLFRLAMQP
jgi:6-phosphofructokinase 2